MPDKFQVPSSLTLEPNPFEQSFAGKSNNGQESVQSQSPMPQVPAQQQRLPGVQGLTSPAPLLATPGQWQQGTRLSPAILPGQEGLPGAYQPSMPSPAVLLEKSAGDFKVSKKPPPKRPSKVKQEVNEDDKKRTLFLERNRIAAVKCRQRKKQWVDDLKSKVEFYQNANEELAVDVARLRANMEQVKQYVYSIQDPRRIPPQILALMETPPSTQTNQHQPTHQQPPPQSAQSAQPVQPGQHATAHQQVPPQPPNQPQGQDYQNVVLMVPQQVMMPGSRPN